MSEETVIDVDPKVDDTESDDTADETLETGTAVERSTDPDPRNVAVAQAAEAMITMPGVAGRDEFLSLAAQARMISLSGAAPEAVRNNPYVAFHVAMVGRDLGLSPTAAIELIDVIPGRGGPQLSLSPQLMNAQVHRVYGGEIVKTNSQADRCTAVAIGPGGRDQRCRRQWPTTSDRAMHVEDCTCDVIGEAQFTWEDARMAGLVGPNCQPGEHVKNQRRGDRQVCGCNQGYITYPKRMMWQRACGFAADDYFPGAGLGLYTPEALGATVDVDGRPIDPATVELPAGYEDPRDRKRGRAAVKDELAPEDERRALKALIDSLPVSVKHGDTGLVGRWREAEFPPVMELPAGLMRRAKVMVRGFESKARQDGWEPPTLTAPETTPESAPESPSTDSRAPGDTGQAEIQETATQSPILANNYPTDETEQRKVIASELAEALEDVPAAVADAATRFVKEAGWQKVDKALRQRGEDIDGLHVDSRRMLMVAYLVAEFPETGVPGDGEFLEDEA